MLGVTTRYLEIFDSLTCIGKVLTLISCFDLKTFVTTPFLNQLLMKRIST